MASPSTPPSPAGAVVITASPPPCGAPCAAAPSPPCTASSVVGAGVSAAGVPVLSVVRGRLGGRLPSWGCTQCVGGGGCALLSHEHEHAEGSRHSEQHTAMQACAWTCKKPCQGCALACSRGGGGGGGSSRPRIPATSVAVPGPPSIWPVQHISRIQATWGSTAIQNAP